MTLPAQLRAIADRIEAAEAAPDARLDALLAKIIHVGPSPIEPAEVPGLDPGIAAVVRILRIAGLNTIESCEGGAGHCSPEPFVKFGGSVAEAMHAVAAVLFNPTHGLRPYALRQVWTLMDGWPDGPSWELTFFPPTTAQWPWYWPGVDGWEPSAMRDGSSIEPIEQAAAPASAARSGDGALPPPVGPAPSPDNAGAVGEAPTPARQAGDAGSTPATRSKPSARSLLPKKDRGALRPARAPRADAPTAAAGDPHRHPPKPGDGRVGDFACVCGRHFAWKPSIAIHQKGCPDYLEAATVLAVTDKPLPAGRTAAARLAARDSGRTSPRAARSVAPAAGVTRPGSVAPAPVLRHGTETFLCSRCPMKFDSRERLERHLVVDHPDTTPRRLPVGDPEPVFGERSGGGFRD
jgi:hypothetical protein